MRPFRKKFRRYGLLIAPVLIFLATQTSANDITIVPPAGWQQVPASNDTTVLALKGPAQSSFLLIRIPLSEAHDLPSARTFLIDFLDSFNSHQHANFSSIGQTEQANFPNDISAYYLRAAEQSKLKLILVVFTFGGQNLLGVLTSSVPDLVLPEMLGALKTTGAITPSAAQAAPQQSLDGQIRLTLTQGLTLENLSPEQQKDGFVLSVRGLASELTLMKVSDADNTSLNNEPEVVQQMVRAFADSDLGTIKHVRAMPTAAGPILIYSWAKLKTTPGQAVAGYLPWCYWGYSLLAEGPRALDLTRAVAATLSLGSSAFPKLVANTPEVPLPWHWPRRNTTALEIFGAIALIILVAFFYRRFLVGYKR